MNDDNTQSPVAVPAVVPQFPESAFTKIPPEPTPAQKLPGIESPQIVNDGMLPNAPGYGPQHPDVAVTINSNIGDIFFDPNRSGYQIPNARGGFVFVNETGVSRELMLRGYNAKPAIAGTPSSVDIAINKIQRTQDLTFSGALAGYPVGLHHDGSRRILVTEAASLIVPASGEWCFLRNMLTEMFNQDGCEQLPYFFGWLKIAYEALRAGSRRPGQAVVLAGPHDSAKSLLQRQVITPLLGGREARPYRYMRGGTEFNADLFGAEHLILEDETPSTDLRSRRNFGAHIKAITVNETQSCHPKGRTAVTLSPFWRLSISLNEEPENLMVLPPIEPSLEDKVMLFRVTRPTLPSTKTETQRQALRSMIAAELPAFLDWLVNWDIPTELTSGRFGVRHWHHPELLHSLAALSPEVRLLELLDLASEELWLMPDQSWRGSAENLEAALLARTSPVQRQAEQLFSFSRACGTYLGRLAESHPERVQLRRTSKRNEWVIFAPQSGEVEDDLAILDAIGSTG